MLARYLLLLNESYIWKNYRYCFQEQNYYNMTLKKVMKDHN